MKPKNTFVVEVKKSRRLDGKRTKRSLWAGVDLEEAKRQNTDNSQTAPVRSHEQADETDIADPAPIPAEPAQPRILPVVLNPAAPEVQASPAEDEPPVEIPDDSIQADQDVGKRPYRRRQPRLRRWRQTSLPPGQRWKRRLPRVLQK